MNPVRFAFLLALGLAACDSNDAATPKSSPSKADAKAPSSRSDNAAKNEAPAPPRVSAAFELPSGAEDAGKALSKTFDGKKFGVELTGEHRDGLLWIAAHGTDPAQVSEAFYELNGMDPEKAAVLATKVAVSRMDDENLDVFDAAIQTLTAWFFEGTVDPLAAQTLLDLITSSADAYRKTQALNGLLGTKVPAVLPILKAALKTDQLAVQASALASIRNPKDAALQASLVELVQPFMTHEHPAVVAEALAAHGELSQQEDATARKAVEGYLESEHPIVRAYALLTWAKLAQRDAAPAMLEALEDASKLEKKITVPYPDGGGSFTVGRHRGLRDVRSAVPGAQVLADRSLKRRFVQWSDAKDVASYKAELEAWAKASPKP